MEGAIICGLGATKAKRVYCNNYIYTPACRWFLDEYLRMEDYDVMVNCCVFMDGKQGYFEPPDKVFISQHLFKKDAIRTLFHELKHYYQYKNGIYDFNPKDYQRQLPEDTGKLERYLIRYAEYMAFPWEVDARNTSMNATREFWSSEASASLKKASLDNVLFPALGRTEQNSPE